MAAYALSKKITAGIHPLGEPRTSQFSRRVHRRAAIMVAGICLGLFASGPARALAALDEHPSSIAAMVAGAEARPSAMPKPNLADFLGEPASNDARQVADWVVNTGDNRSLPFVVVDKKATKVFVFDAHGHLLGATPALLGLARGDDSVPGIGDRKLSDIRPEERTTAAGRFVAALGHSLGPQDVLWVDYPSGLALHRVLAKNTKEARLQRLAAASPLDHRITFGCINVPANFFDSVVDPAFTGTNGIVYILPEIKSIRDVFSESIS